MDIQTGMNRELGTKWFTFYTKVRPWLAGISALMVLTNFCQAMHYYLSNIGILVAAIAQIAGAILSVAVAVKAEEDYAGFVSFVKGALIFDIINVAYQSASQQYYQNGYSIGTVAIVFLIILVLGYFVWYRPNINYFRKRILHTANTMDTTDTNGTDHCDPATSFSEPLATSEPASISQTQETSPHIAPAIPKETTQPRVESNTVAVEKAQLKAEKVRYCKLCGSVIDRSTKVCTGCDKQYFKGIKLSKVAITAIAFVVIIAILSTICVMQQMKIRKMQATIDFLDNELGVLYLEQYENQRKLQFYDKHVVIVPNNGTDTYHKWGCSKLDTSVGGWIYNTEAAVGNGYRACPYCN
jgi:hypothetical protein